MLRKRAAFPSQIGRVFSLAMIEFIAKGVDFMELGKQIYELRKKANLSGAACRKGRCIEANNFKMGAW